MDEVVPARLAEKATRPASRIPLRPAAAFAWLALGGVLGYALRGQRLTLYVRRDAQVAGASAFRYARENGIGVFYWIDGRFGYALSV